MTRDVFLYLRAFILTTVLCTSAHAQTVVAQQDLYLDAMKSLAEGRKEDASDALTRMIEQEPQHAGAWLDLAIIQCELGHKVEAERLFRTIETKFAPPPGILEVIAKQRANGCKGWQAASRTTITMARGTDSNVNQGASSSTFTLGNEGHTIDLQLLPDYLPQRDQYRLLSAEYSRDLTQNGGVGFVQTQVRQNDSLKRYDTASAALGAELPWRLSNWTVRGAGTLGLLTLDGKLYQQQGQFQLRISPPTVLPEKVQLSMLSSLTHIRYPTLTDFDSNTWELRGLLNYRSSLTQAQASVGYLTDSAAKGRPGGNRDGWYLNLQTHTSIWKNVVGELGWTRQTWTGASVYSPGLINRIRHQDTQIFRAALNAPISDHQNIQIELREVRNKENISIFQYKDHQLQVSWQWRMF